MMGVAGRYKAFGVLESTVGMSEVEGQIWAHVVHTFPAGKLSGVVEMLGRVALLAQITTSTIKDTGFVLLAEAVPGEQIVVFDYSYSLSDDSSSSRQSHHGSADPIGSGSGGSEGIGGGDTANADVGVGNRSKFDWWFENVFVGPARKGALKDIGVIATRIGEIDFEGKPGVHILHFLPASKLPAIKAAFTSEDGSLKHGGKLVVSYSHSTSAWS
jgi:hypothetical protein